MTGLGPAGDGHCNCSFNSEVLLPLQWTTTQCVLRVFGFYDSDTLLKWHFVDTARVCVHCICPFELISNIAVVQQTSTSAFSTFAESVTIESLIIICLFFGSTFLVGGNFLFLNSVW